MINQIPSIFIAHGGGPLPILQKEKHIEMYKQFDEIKRRYPNPKAIIVFSAHWEQKQWSLLDTDSPGLLYDYTAFPQPAYSLQYPCKSSKQLREEVAKSIEKNGIKLKSFTEERGYDHGVFIPLMIMYPEANIPVIQISLLQSLDPEQHFKMGVAVRELKKNGFLILGSGASAHGGFGRGDSYEQSKQFDKDLTALCLQKSSEEELLDKIKNWRKLKFAEELHPREEHLVPLFVVLGAAQGQPRERWGLYNIGLELSNFICP